MGLCVSNQERKRLCDERANKEKQQSLASQLKMNGSTTPVDVRIINNRQTGRNGDRTGKYKLNPQKTECPEAIRQGEDDYGDKPMDRIMEQVGQNGNNCKKQTGQRYHSRYSQKFRIPCEVPQTEQLLCIPNELFRKSTDDNRLKTSNSSWSCTFRVSEFINSNKIPERDENKRKMNGLQIVHETRQSRIQLIKIQRQNEVIEAGRITEPVLGYIKRKISDMGKIIVRREGEQKKDYQEPMTAFRKKKPERFNQNDVPERE